MGPFVVTTRIGEVAYHLDLKGCFTCIHLVFHMSLLYSFVVGGDRIKPPELIFIKYT